MTTKLSLNMSNVDCRTEPPQVKYCWPRSSKVSLGWVRTNGSEWVDTEEPQQPLGNEILSFGPSPQPWLHPQAGQSYPQLSDSAFLPSAFWLPAAWPDSSMKQPAGEGRRHSPARYSQWCPRRAGVAPQAPGSDPVCFIPAVGFQQAAPQEANLEALSSGSGEMERDFKGPLGACSIYSFLSLSTYTKVMSLSSAQRDMSSCWGLRTSQSLGETGLETDVLSPLGSRKGQREGRGWRSQEWDCRTVSSGEDSWMVFQNKSHLELGLGEPFSLCNICLLAILAKSCLFSQSNSTLFP